MHVLLLDVVGVSSAVTSARTVVDCVGDGLRFKISCCPINRLLQPHTTLSVGSYRLLTTKELTYCHKVSCMSFDKAGFSLDPVVKIKTRVMNFARFRGEQKVLSFTLVSCGMQRRRILNTIPHGMRAVRTPSTLLFSEQRCRTTIQAQIYLGRLILY